MTEIDKANAMCTQIHTTKYIKHLNQQHEGKTRMRIHVYKRSQYTSTEGEDKTLHFKNVL